MGFVTTPLADLSPADLAAFLETQRAAYEALKGRGLILTNDGEHFIARIVAPNGVFTNEQMQMVTDVARKYGDGRVALTVRLTIEVQGIPYENLEPLVAEVEAAGLVTGGMLGAFAWLRFASGALWIATGLAACLTLAGLMIARRTPKSAGFAGPPN